MRILSILTIIVFALCITPSAPRAGEVIKADASHDNGVFHLDLEMVVKGQPDLIRHLITDFDHLEALNEAIVESQYLGQPEPFVQKMRIVTEDCVLIFCARMVQVQEVRQRNDGSLLVTILPDGSTYSHGQSEWRFEDVGHGETRMRVKAELAPRTFLPPFVGPMLVADLFQKRSISMMEHIEQLTTDWQQPINTASNTSSN